MYLPTMRKVNPVQVSYLAPSTIEVLLGNIWMLSIFIVVIVDLVFIANLFNGAPLLSSIIWIILIAALIFGLNLGLVYDNRSRQYNEAMFECGRRYCLKPGTYFCAICDLTRSWVSIMLAFDIEDFSLEPEKAYSRYCLAEYRIHNRDIEDRECDEYLLKDIDGKVIEQTFTTKFGFEIKVYGLTEDNELEFEIIGLKKLGRIFRKINKDQ